jgi:DNA polymerase-3 subunit alpha
VESATATYIFDLMEKFAAYGFNKSHSAAYALISYQTAWLKWHYPAAFMAAALSSDMDNTDKVVLLIEECRRMELTILPPSVNDSEIKFSVSLQAEKTLYYGLGAIKGAGEAALEGIIEARKTDNAYQDLFDFCRRVDLRKCNRRVLDSLIRAGALDCFQQDREVLLASLPIAFKMAEQDAVAQASGQNDLFGMPDKVSHDDTAQEKPYVTEGFIAWTEAERLIGEKETLGLYLSGHPIVYYLPELARFSQRLNTMSAIKGKKVIVAGLVHEMRMRTTGRGKMAFLTLDDQSGRLEVKMFSKVLEAHQDLLVKDSILVVEGEVGEDSYNGGLSMNAQNIMDIPTARARFAQCLRLDLNADDEDKISQIERIMTPFRQAESCPVIVNYENAAGLKARLRFGGDWHVKLDDALLAQLSQLVGKNKMELVFK